MPNYRTTSQLGVLSLVAISLLACPKQGTESPEPQPSQTETTGVSDGADPAAPETDEQACQRMLARFGEDMAEAELDACVEARIGGTELDVCREAGFEADYRSCFESCMASVDIDPAEYDPGDSSSSPVVNCVAGCFATTGCE